MASKPQSGDGQKNRLLQAALYYARKLNWPDFPLKEGGKEPLTAHGHKDATTDEKQIGACWKKNPHANIGVPTGIHFWVLDVDPRHGGDESLQALIYKHGAMPGTLQQITGGGGRHYCFKIPESLTIGCGNIGPGLDIKGAGGYIVVAPSIHPDTGKEYVWDGAEPVHKQPILDAPPWLIDAIRTAQNGHAYLPISEHIPWGQGHDTLKQFGINMFRATNCPRDLLVAALWKANQEYCDPRSRDDTPKKMEALADWIISHIKPWDKQKAKPPSNQPRDEDASPPPEQKETGPGPRAESMSLPDVHQVFKKWLHLPDPGVVTVTVSAIAANRIEGDPVWPLLIGPPASGKTEILDSLLGLPNMHPAGTLSEAALLSGSPNREKAADASGGLLRAIGKFGFIVCKDFTSVLSMSREVRTPLLAALREVYDGHWVRHIGTDGGRTLPWSGKAVLIGGCTPIIDQYHAVTAAMGERFVFCRLPDIKPQVQARQALLHVGKEVVMRRELREAVQGLFAGFDPIEFALDDDASVRLSALATLVARSRSAVERDGYHREVELIPGSELPARLVLSLARLFHGMQMLGASKDECWRLVTKVALDCIPDVRRRVFQFLQARDVASTTTDIALNINYPTNTARRALEDLAAHGVVNRYSKGKGNPDEWELSLFSCELVKTAGIPDVTVPEKSEGVKEWAFSEMSGG
jgi:hypothetical protein